MTRTRTVLRGLAAVGATMVLVAGVPVGLWRLVGSPLPETIPSWADLARALRDTYIPDQALVNTLAVVCWLAWAQLTVALAVEAVATIRGRQTPRLPLSRPAQVLAARLITTITLLSALSAPRTATTNLPTVAPVLATDTTPAASTQTAPHPPRAEPDDAERQASDRRKPRPRYQVQRRDDLWSIAERHLGDPYRWTEIWQLNRGHTYPDGRTFTDPDLIHPGWTLDLPRDATNLPPDTDAAPIEPRDANQPPHTDDDQHKTNAADNETGHHPRGRERPNRPTDTPTSRPATRHDQPDHADDETSGRVDAPEPTEHDGVDDDDVDAAHDDGRAVVGLPSGSIVGWSLVAGIAAALAAARLHRRHTRTSREPAAGIRHDDPLTDPNIRRVQRAHHTNTHPTDPAVGNLLDRTADPPGGIAASPLTPVTLGDHDGHPVTIDLASTGGVAVDGSGAADVARALLVDFLATPRRVILCDRTTAELLLPDAPDVPGMQITDDLASTLSQVEVELVARTRRLDHHDAPDYATLLADHPDEPTPTMLIATSCPDPALRPRLDAIAHLGQRLGVGTLIHNPTPTAADATGPAVAITATDEHTAADARGVDLPPGSQLCTLTAEDARGFLAVIAASRPTPTPDDAPATTADTPPTDDAPDHDATFPRGAQAMAPGKAVGVRLLGPPAIDVAGEPIRTGLRHKARELLAALLIHPDGLTTDAAVELLWPDANPTRGTQRLYTVVANLRATLRDTTGRADHPIIDHTDGRYHADPHLFDCDLWRFQTALADATTATSDDERIAALGQAVDAYTGDLVAGTFYEWTEAAREDLRRRAVDAAARLAELHQTAGNHDAALAALDTAMRHDPYAEDLYRRTMRIHAALGRHDAIRRTYQLLETRLADLDVDPTDATTTLRNQLLEHAEVRDRLHT